MNDLTKAERQACRATYELAKGSGVQMERNMCFEAFPRLLDALDAADARIAELQTWNESAEDRISELESELSTLEYTIELMTAGPRGTE